MSNIVKQLEQVRRNLLDLTMRNRLLNYKETKRRSIKVIDELPSEVYDILVINERVMNLLPQKKESQQTSQENDQNINLFITNDNNDESEELMDEISRLWEYPSENDTLDEKYTDRFLQTPYDGQNLQHKLFYISQQSKSVFEERGYTVLYLALGFLHWLESPSSKIFRKAPLILIPCILERLKVSSTFRLSWNQDDITTNISLQAKLQEQSIGIPEFEMSETKLGIDDYFKAVTKSIKNFPDWKLTTDIYLDFFSFTKFIMYRDLDPDAWPDDHSPDKHHLMNSILDPSDNENFEVGFDESEIDRKLKARDLYHVTDADPSQIAVIEDVKNGNNLVVEGPPGTGKSQTITNVISELLAQNKKVLFVSAKMAALEVVKSRLDEVGIGTYCLELHSHKTNKKAFLKELEKTLAADPPSDEVPMSHYSEIEKLRNDLNEYAEQLGKPFGKLQMTPFMLFQQKESDRSYFKRVNRECKRIRLQITEDFSPDDYDNCRTIIHDLSQVVGAIGKIRDNAWFGCELSELSLPEEDEIKLTIENLISIFDDYKNRISIESEKFGIMPSSNLKSSDASLRILKTIRRSIPIEINVLKSGIWDAEYDKAMNIINNGNQFEELLAITLNTFRDEAIDNKYLNSIETYKKLSQGFFRIFNKSFRILNKELKQLYKTRAPFSHKKKLLDLDQLRKTLIMRKKLGSDEIKGTEFFGSLWNGFKSDFTKLAQVSEWFKEWKNNYKRELITEECLKVIANGIDINTIDIHINDYEHFVEKLTQLLMELFSRLNFDFESIFSKDLQIIPFDELIDLVKKWREELGKLLLWTKYISIRNSCNKTAAKPIIDIIETEEEIYSEDFLHLFTSNFTDEYLRFAFKDRPALSNFITQIHENKIKEFSDLDRNLLIFNRIRLMKMLQKRLPNIYSGASKSSELGILLGEFNRKRGHMPIRKLMKNASNLIQNIKPCFMMSPLSVALFLDPTSVKFDVVIFDEASQVRPEEALGSLLRGNQLTVMGDTKQLPPTSFFDIMVDSEFEGEDEDQSASVSDMESLLHQCKRCFPSKTLKWHYRSKHESLIAVSNQEFYHNQLLFYPSPISDPDALGLQFHYTEKSIYDRGRSSTNRIEARGVAIAAIQHYRNHPNKSLGIGTFNIKQQQAILEEVELQLRLNHDMEEYFSSNQPEHFFVKNLETIQGDERDVIFISVGYGFTIDKKLFTNFGPLNREGGERRLNVLITRARERCVVFSNFRSNHLDTKTDSPFGLKALKVFLKFAEEGILDDKDSSMEDSDSPFEDSVIEFIENGGYKVKKQVGCAGFRIDIGVVDPEEAGNYILAVECDGAKYHSSPVARDRDRLRQQILENRGWTIHRIWSTDWYRNRLDCEKRLLSAIDAAILGKQIKGNKKVNHDVLLANDLQFQSKQNKLPLLNISGENFIDKVLSYSKCQSLGIKPYWELHETPLRELAQAVCNVVNVEGPVHEDEIVTRVRTLWGLKRSGDRIKEAIHNAITVALKQKNIQRIKKNSSFFISDSSKPKLPRKRIKDLPPRIQYICELEIEEAIKFVLKHQFSTSRDDLVIQSSRVLGFKSTSKDTFKSIETVIKKLIKNNKLSKTQNDFISISVE
ncbi:MAG: DUF3320 domain-containing protein [candidate division Zixibacteria bacterium]|nr:DUF3320 domain-containing protein [Candidatus Tariuqbacter arcticus]